MWKVEVGMQKFELGECGVGAASSRDQFIPRLEAAPTPDATCSFQITGLFNYEYRVKSSCL